MHKLRYQRVHLSHGQPPLSEIVKVILIICGGIIATTVVKFSERTNNGQANVRTGGRKPYNSMYMYLVGCWPYASGGGRVRWTALLGGGPPEPIRAPVFPTYIMLYIWIVWIIYLFYVFMMNSLLFLRFKSRKNLTSLNILMYAVLVANNFISAFYFYTFISRIGIYTIKECWWQKLSTINARRVFFLHINSINSKFFVR